MPFSSHSPLHPTRERGDSGHIVLCCWPGLNHDNKLTFLSLFTISPYRKSEIAIQPKGYKKKKGLKIAEVNVIGGIFKKKQKTHTKSQHKYF